MARSDPIEAEIAGALALNYGAEHPSISCEAAYRDALRAIARDVPDPAEFARQLPLVFVESLLTATRSQDPLHCGEFRVSDEMARPMQQLGLVAVGGPYLGLFGGRVRKALIEEEAS